MPGPSEADISKISGSKRPEAAGHRFGPDLICIECGKTWEIHQVDPTVCTPGVEHTPRFAPRTNGGQ